MTPTDKQWRGPRREHRVVEIPRGERHDIDLGGHEGWRVVGVLAGREYDDCATLSHVVVDVVLMERDVE